ncbi:hypothetical protein YQE_08796, partial [Dendroctonus ponderosae]
MSTYHACALTRLTPNNLTIWSKGVQKSRDALLDAHPSLDAGDALKRPDAAPSGADIVSRELDEFNGRYQYLVDVLYGRLQEIASFNPNDIVTLIARNVGY